MSVEKVVRKDGALVWRVRWRQAGQNRAKVLGRKRDAEAFDAELKRRRRLGELDVAGGGAEHPPVVAAGQLAEEDRRRRPGAPGPDLDLDRSRG